MFGIVGGSGRVNWLHLVKSELAGQGPFFSASEGCSYPQQFLYSICDRDIKRIDALFLEWQLDSSECNEDLMHLR